MISFIDSICRADHAEPEWLTNPQKLARERADTPSNSCLFRMGRISTAKRSPGSDPGRHS